MENSMRSQKEIWDELKDLEIEQRVRNSTIQSSQNVANGIEMVIGILGSELSDHKRTAKESAERSIELDKQIQALMKEGAEAEKREVLEGKRFNMATGEYE
ncbi:hypothetical protein [Methanolapillus millepedarum]|uniref:Uncharacterized protein n=1 Tax=Methanolapillus millepedarum TaxID=3028296 RepID=A0AA96V425_9EURY|nr:hypothetical protein MsAc7_17870 [Methanosarcinaceae archaeon Ac7]